MGDVENETQNTLPEFEQKQIQLIKLNDEHILSADIECTDGQTIEAKNS